LIRITVFRNLDLVSNFLNRWLIAILNVGKFYFVLCLQATVITDKFLTLTHSDAVVGESDQRKLLNYLLHWLIQRAVKEYWSEKIMLDMERVTQVTY
jgi:hypothetical protein